MFDKENFIADYIEAIKNKSLEQQKQVMDRLTSDQSWDYRKELVEEIIEKLRELDGDHADQIQFLQDQHKLIDAVKMEEQRKQDSAAEVAKDTAAEGQTTEEVKTDGSAEADADAKAEDSEAPAVEEEAEKTESKE